MQVELVASVREVSDSCLQFWGGMGLLDVAIKQDVQGHETDLFIGRADEVMLGII